MRNPARICIMLPRFSRYGGVEQFGFRLAEALGARGHAVDFICARQEAEPPAGVRVIAVGRPPGPRVGKMLWFLLRAEQVRKKGDYDLSIGLGKTWNQDVLRVGGGPLRNYRNLSEQALPEGFPRRFKRLRRLLSPSDWLTLAVERRQYSGAATVLAVSDLVAEWIMGEHPGMDRERLEVIYNLPDFSRFFPPLPEARAAAREALWADAGQAGAPQGVFLGTASTNFVLKGVGPLIRALALLPDDHHLFVAGGRGNAEYLELAGSLGVAERVHFLGKVEDMPAFYKALDVFVLPTFYDACSNAVLEAAATGVRVLSTPFNGSSRFLPAERMLADPGDPGCLAAGIRDALAAPAPAPPAPPAGLVSGLAAFVERIETMLPK